VDSSSGKLVLVDGELLLHIGRRCLVGAYMHDCPWHRLNFPNEAFASPHNTAAALYQA
jgi:hypothetical protein